MKTAGGDENPALQAQDELPRFRFRRHALSKEYVRIDGRRTLVWFQCAGAVLAIDYNQSPVALGVLWRTPGGEVVRGFLDADEVVVERMSEAQWVRLCRRIERGSEPVRVSRRIAVAG